MAEPDWLELAWKLSGSGMSKTRFAEVYADKIGNVPAGSHSAKAAVAALAPVPDQTNAEVSDERLTLDHQQQADNYLEALLGYSGGFYGAAIKAGLPAAETVGPIAHIERAARELHRLALNRRSVTSQASEGEVVAWRIRERPGFPWQFVDYDPARMPNVRGWEHDPLYASPSKRVERLETVEPKTLDEWSEDDGDVVWWCWRDGAWLGEAAYIGTPLDLGRGYALTIGDHEFVVNLGGWPGYHTHWTPHPTRPQALQGGRS